MDRRVGTARRVDDSDYGLIFTFWDRLFGTFRPVGARKEVGLDTVDIAARQTVRAMLAEPWRPLVKHSPAKAAAVLESPRRCGRSRSAPRPSGDPRSLVGPLAAARVACRNTADARPFYSDQLGLTEIAVRPDWHVYDVGSAQLIVEAVPEGEPDDDVGRFAAISFAVDDVGRTCEELEARGVVVVGRPDGAARTPQHRAARLFLHDVRGPPRGLFQ